MTTLTARTNASTPAVAPNRRSPAARRRTRRTLRSRWTLRLAPAHLLGAVVTTLVLVVLIQVFWFVLSPNVEGAANPRPAIGVESRTPASLDVLAHQIP
jgi:hypothetical protein